MTELDTIEAKVAQLLAARLHLDVPSRDTDLFEAGLLDSLAFVDLVMDLEQTFGLRVSPDDLEVETFRSIERIARFVCDRREAGFSQGPRRGGSVAIAESASRRVS